MTQAEKQRQLKRIRNRRWRRKNWETIRARRRAQWMEHREKRLAAKRAWRAANPEAKRAENQAFKAKNPHYQRDYYWRCVVRDGWRKWAGTCAASRSRLEALA